MEKTNCSDELIRVVFLINYKECFILKFLLFITAFLFYIYMHKNMIGFMHMFGKGNAGEYS